MRPVNATILRLKKKIEKLISENQELRNKLSEISHPTMLAGIRGEDLITRLTKGWKSNKGASYDIKLVNGAKVEVKLSKLNKPSKISSSLRWTWHGLLSGFTREKQYDYLVLIGENKGRYRIENDKASYAYFLLTREQAEKLVDRGSSRGHINFFPKPAKRPNLRRARLLKFRKTKTEISDFFRQVATAM
jgi:hypothetical protein